MVMRCVPIAKEDSEGDEMARAVKVDRKRLLARLHENRQKHEKEYLEACGGYKTRMIEEAQKLVEQAKRLKPGDRLSVIGLMAPEDHRLDYDRAIDRMEWETGEEVLLTEGDFNTFIRDEWHWSHGFKATLSAYNNSGEAF